MAVFGQRADGEERIAVTGFNDPGQSGADVGWQRCILVPIDGMLSRRCGELRRCRDLRLVQGSSHEGKHAAINVTDIHLRDDVGLKIRDQLGCVVIASVDAVTQML
jgi:hypothetical protein